MTLHEMSRFMTRL